MHRPCVVIVGGGITGLAAAHHIQESGAPVEAILLERADRLGGCIFTERAHGFVMEHGADVFLARKPHAAQLCGALGLTLQAPVQRRAYVRRDVGLYPLPAGFSGLVPARAGPLVSTRLLTVRGKARLLLERFVPPYTAGAEESVQDFFMRRYGREAYARIMAPLLGGLSGGDPAQLSLEAQLPHLRTMEQVHGSLLRAMARGPRSRGAALRSLTGGLGTLIEALYGCLDPMTVRTSVSVCAVQKRSTGFTVRLDGGGHQDADAVLIAAPAYAAAAMLATLDAELADALGAIQYGATILVHLAFRASQVPRALDASGYIAAPGAGSLVAASTWSSAKLEGRAPADHVLLRVVLGRNRTDAVFGMSDADLLGAACDEVRDVLGITARPLLWRVHRWHRSLPQYVLGHPARCEQIAALCSRHPGLQLAGAAYYGAGIPDCIRSGRRAAEAILSKLELKHAPEIRATV